MVLETDSHHAAALAVEQGVGICLGILPFMRPWSAARRVQMIGALTTRIDERAYLVYGLHNERNRNVPLLHEWLRATLAEAVRVGYVLPTQLRRAEIVECLHG